MKPTPEVKKALELVDVVANLQNQLQADTIPGLQMLCWKIAEEHGWHEREPLLDDDGDPIIPNVGLKLALVHSELSEALEEMREGKFEIYYDGDEPKGFGIELADAVIRILDIAESLGISMCKCLDVKCQYNKTRPYRHGGKKA